MTKRWPERFGLIAALMLVFASALAQEAPTDTTTTDKANADKQQSDTTTPEAAPAAEKLNSITFGLPAWRVGGLSQRLFEYNRIPWPFELRLFSPIDKTRPFTTIHYAGLPGFDDFGEGFMGANHGRTVIKASFADNTYFFPGYPPTNASSDHTAKVLVDQALRPNLGAYLYAAESVRNQAFVPPIASLRNTTRAYAAGLQGRKGAVSAGANVSENRFSDDSGQQPVTLRHHADGTVGMTIAPNLDVSVSAGYTKVQQFGLKSSGIGTVALAANMDLDDTTMLGFSIAGEHFQLPNVANAYLKRRVNTSLNLSHWWDGGKASLGWSHREEARLTADHTYTDIPKWTTFKGRVAGKMQPGLRYDLNATWESLTSAAQMQTDDPTQLQWDDKVIAQARIFGGSNHFNGYAAYTYRFRQNVARHVRIGSHNFMVGGGYVFGPRLSTYVELAHDEYQVGGGSTDETMPSLSSWFRRDNSAGLGMNLKANGRESYGLSLNYFQGSNFLGDQLTVRYGRQMKPGQSLELVVAPWRYDDRLYGLTGYNATLVGVKYTVKF